MLLKHITTIIQKHMTHFIFGIFVFMSRSRSIYVVFFIFSLIFIVIDSITSLKQTPLFFVQILEYVLLFWDDNLDEECKLFSNSKSSASGCCLAFAWFFANFCLGLLIKVLIKKRALQNWVFLSIEGILWKHFLERLSLLKASYCTVLFKKIFVWNITFICKFWNRSN